MEFEGIGVARLEHDAARRASCRWWRGKPTSGVRNSMFTVLQRYRVRLGTVADAATRAEESLVPRLKDVTGFELAAHRSIMTGRNQTIDFSVDPAPVIAALRAGRVPPPLPAESVQLTVTAPQLQDTA